MTAKPIDMVLHCPACGLQHIDAPDTNDMGAEGQHPWTNPPHRSHLCHGCGHIWRPADVPTNGVAAITTAGQHDSPIRPAPSRPVLEDRPVDERRTKLTDNQAQVLRNSVKRKAWIGGWVWGSQSATEAIFRALTKKGLAVPAGDERYTPCYYRLTDAGVAEGLRIAEEAGDNIAEILSAHARQSRAPSAGASGGQV